MARARRTSTGASTVTTRSKASAHPASTSSVASSTTMPGVCLARARKRSRTSGWMASSSRRQGVDEQHGAGERADAAGDRRDGAGDGCHAVVVDVADEQRALGAEALELGGVSGEGDAHRLLALQPIDADVDDDGARLDVL